VRLGCGWGEDPHFFMISAAAAAFVPLSFRPLPLRMPLLIEEGLRLRGVSSRGSPTCLPPQCAPRSLGA